MGLRAHPSQTTAVQGCQIFLIPCTKMGETIQNYQMAIKCTIGRKKIQRALEYTNLFHSKALQNLPKLKFLVWKYTIWQPCCRPPWKKADTIKPGQPFSTSIFFLLYFLLCPQTNSAYEVGKMLKLSVSLRTYMYKCPETYLGGTQTRILFSRVSCDDHWTAIATYQHCFPEGHIQFVRLGISPNVLPNIGWFLALFGKFKGNVCPYFWPNKSCCFIQHVFKIHLIFIGIYDRQRKRN
jgi:hypothetical protein